ncbi:MAG: SpaA isopeptide-forming pilin-related protein [Clostridium sp.]
MNIVENNLITKIAFFIFIIALFSSLTFYIDPLAQPISDSTETKKNESSKINSSIKKNLGSLEILKVDLTSNKPLEGAILKITGPNNYSTTSITNKNGRISIPNVPFGSYSIKEIKAPIGYKDTTNIQTIIINKNSKPIYNLTFKTERIKNSKYISSSKVPEPLNDVSSADSLISNNTNLPRPTSPNITLKNFSNPLTNIKPLFLYLLSIIFLILFGGFSLFLKRTHK